jgi:hypothetical protein
LIIESVDILTDDFETDLIWKLRWAQGHDAEAKRIVLAGHQFVRDLLIDKTVTQYQQQVIVGGALQQVLLGTRTFQQSKRSVSLHAGSDAVGRAADAALAKAAQLRQILLQPDTRR